MHQNQGEFGGWLGPFISLFFRDDLKLKIAFDFADRILYVALMKLNVIKEI